MPSKKGSIAYENRLARRRAQRAIGKLENQLNSGALSRAEESQVRFKISAMREDIAATYIGRRGHEVQSREEAARAAERLSSRDYDRESVDFTARNAQTAKQIGNTYYVDKQTKQHVQNPLSDYTEGEMRTFWRATQNIWDKKDVPRNRRYEAIIKAVADAQGIDPSQVDLRELMDAIINDKTSNAKDWEAAIQRKNMRLANGDDVGQDEVQDFSSEDVAKYETEKNIAEVLEKYRQRYGAQNEAQEE